MNITRVKVYQAVKVGKHVETIYPNMKMKDVGLELMPSIGVKISHADLNIIVPFPNIAYIEIDEQETKVKRGKAKKE